MSLSNTENAGYEDALYGRGPQRHYTNREEQVAYDRGSARGKSTRQSYESYGQSVGGLPEASIGVLKPLVEYSSFIAPGILVSYPLWARLYNHLFDDGRLWEFEATMLFLFALGVTIFISLKAFSFFQGARGKIMVHRMAKKKLVHFETLLMIWVIGVPTAVLSIIPA